MKQFRVIWSRQSLSSVKEIYDYYKEKSLQGAGNVRRDLFNAPKAIHFSRQFQVDEINPKYRRIVIRDYKLLYREEKDVIYIMDVVSTRESPEKIRRK